MSPEEAYSQMAAVTKMTAEDWRDFMSCSEADQTILIQNYKDLHGTPSISGWEKALEIGMKCVEIAGMIIPIVGAVSAVYGLAVQIKNS